MALAIRALPPGLAARLVEAFCKWTRRRSSRSDKKDKRALRQLGTDRFKKGYDVFLCAHLHGPSIQSVDAGGRHGLLINVGDWWNHDSYVVERNGIYSLHLDEEDDRPWATPIQPQQDL